MDITYLADLQNPFLPDKDILFSLKKYGKVRAVDIRKFDLRKEVKKSLKTDLFLFHGQMGNFDEQTFNFVLDNLSLFLSGINGKKFLWFFNKIWLDNMKVILKFYDVCDRIYVSDGTWLKRFKTDRIKFLPPACSEKRIRGKFRKEMKCDIALFGGVYGNREKQYDFLKKKFGGRLKLFRELDNRELADLCQSAKIIVFWREPYDDFFFSKDFYRALSYKGFCLHPRFQGLEEQGFKDGIHYVSYHTDKELEEAIKIFLDKKTERLRKRIAEQGQRLVITNHNYKERLKEIIYEN